MDSTGIYMNLLCKGGSGIRGLLVKSTTVAIVAAGVAIGQAGSWGTDIARASTHQVTLRYSCKFPVIGSGPITGVASWDFPDSVTVGKPVPPVPFSVTVQVPAAYAGAAYRFLGVHSASGYGDANVMVTSPQGDLSVPVWASVPSTPVPASGPGTVVITSKFPSLTPTRPGVAKISVGTITMHITPRNAAGNLMFLGTVTATCTPQTGQSVFVTSILITPAPPIAKPATHPAIVRPSPTKAGLRSPAPSPSSASPVSVTPAPAHKVAASSSGQGPGGKNVAIIGGLTLTLAGGAAAMRWLLPWLSRLRA